MYIVIIEDYPSMCMDQVQLEYFDTEEEAKDFVGCLCEQKPSRYGRPTKISICSQLLEFETRTDRFN